MPQQSFNPKARWDRNIPEDSDSAHPDLLNEPIECLVQFKNGKIYPLKFTWHNKDYQIKQTNYAWQERLGQAIISCFSVSTGTDNYQLSFNNNSFGWRLDKIIQ